MKLPQKISSAVRELGFVNTLVYAAHQALSLVGGAMHRYYFVAQPLTSEPMLLGARGRSIVVRLVGADDPALRGMPLDRKVIEYRAGQNAICLGAFKDEKIIGYLWLCIGPYKEDEVRARFVPTPPRQSSWDFDVYVLPEYRLGLGFTKLWEEASRYLRERGVLWSISRISALNRRSLAAHGRLGARRIGTAIFLRLGTLQLTIASLHPYIHFSRSPESIPEFVLRPPDAARQ